MKNSMLKKIASLALAICMVVTLIPATFAADTDTETETVTKTYTFSANATSQTTTDEEGTESTTYYVKAGNYAGKVDKFGFWGWKFLAIDSEAKSVWEDKLLPYKTSSGTVNSGGYNYRVLNLQAPELRLEVSRTSGTGTTNGQYTLSTIQAAFALESPAAGFYRVESKGYTKSDGSKAQLYLGENTANSTDINDYIADANAFYSTANYQTTSADTEDKWAKRTRVALDGIIYSDGATELAFAIDTGSILKYLRDLHLVQITPTISISTDRTEMGVGGTAKATVNATWTEGSTTTTQAMVNSFVDYQSSDEDVLTVDDCGNITAVAAGTATVTATVAGETYTTETITVKELSPEYVEAFKPTTTTTETVSENVTALVYPTTLEVTQSAEENTTAGTWHVTTDETVGEYTFSYWVRGLEDGTRKRIVSFEHEFDYAPQNGSNYLIAVYTKDGETAATNEYYNANGQLVTTGAEPEKPYMLGYGQAKGWISHGNGIFEAEYAGVESYTITVNGTAATYNYGDPVPCVAEAEKNGKKFFGWTKKGEGDAEATLVSADTSYTFYAWEKCEVTAVYKDEEAVFESARRKIFLDTIKLGEDTAVMAEFIGFGSDVVERGIILGTKSYSMTNKNATQFTIVNDDNEANISGYAILADGTKVIYNK